MDRRGRIDEQLAEAELFQGLSSRKLRAITSLTTHVDVRAGTVLTHEGRPGSQFLVLLDGVVAVSAGNHVIATRGPGDFLGEISLIGRRVQTATALATTPVSAAVFSKADFWSMLGAVPSMGDALRSTMRDRLAEVESFPSEAVPVV